MAILNNFENFLEQEYENLATKIFSETVCKDCQNESAPMINTDNMVEKYSGKTKNLLGLLLSFCHRYYLAYTQLKVGSAP
jgi:hypothetical protein